MQIRIFTLPVFSSERSEEILNKFLRSHRVLQMERHFCPENGGYWTILVEYMDGDTVLDAVPATRREKKDYTADLSPEEKERFEHFKTIRRELTTHHSLPAYLIFTNEELAILAKIPELREDTVKDVKGITTAADTAYYY